MHTTQPRHLGSGVAAVIAICICATGCGSGASEVSTLQAHASNGAKSGTIRLFATMKSNGKASVVVTGVVGDFGRYFPANKNGKADSNDNYDEVVLSRGTFLLDERALTNNPFKIHSNESTCSTSLTTTAKVPVSEGTGTYAGIHGTIDAAGRVAFVQPRFKSGSHNGKCESGKKPSAKAYFADLTGHGLVTF
jgi:hypothetical protein